MVQDSFNVGVIGAGVAGCCCCYFIKKFSSDIDLTLFDYSSPLRTILPTGGGRCNLAYAEFDFKELAKNYPRGEKFLYSLFSKFSTSQTLELFEELGIDTYIQDDFRIFPKSNSSKNVREKFLNALKNVKFRKEKVLRIEKEDKFKVVTDMNSYYFDKIIYATGGHSGYEIINRIGVSTVEAKPSLVGLVTHDNYSELKGTTVKNVYNHQTKLSGDILFTHFGVSGPLIYKISAIKARDPFPYTLSFDLYRHSADLQELLNSNPHKYIKNLLSEFLPQKLSQYLLEKMNIPADIECCRINGEMRDMIKAALHNFKIDVKSTKKDGETVTAGGVALDKINSKTMESKEVPGLYFCGEVIDVDGFCGGFNLQNCWSTAYVAACTLSGYNT